MIEHAHTTSKQPRRLDATAAGWLRSRREALSLSQHALAELAGCSFEMIRKIEAGTRQPSLLMAARIVEALWRVDLERALLVARLLRMPHEERWRYAELVRERD